MEATISFVTTHPLQLLATTALVVYSAARNKLTVDGIFAAIVTASVHMLHPWGVFFYLLVTFFMAGTIATKVHYQQKALLTQASSGGSGGEAQSGRTAPQVYANSLPATFLILLDLYMRKTTAHNNSISGLLLPIGIICSYAAATADTLSSELGILSSSTPFLITQPWRKVPRGTNGGVTVLGLLWGLFGGFLIAVAAVILAPRPLPIDDVRFVAGISVAGLFGSVVDSALGALVQATVEDKATGKVVEGENGKRVLVGDGGSRVQRGMDLFNNNGVNFLMTSMTAAVGMAVALAYLR